MGTFTGRTALVIGGSSGMGRGAARAFAARGGNVVVTSRTTDRLPGAVAAVAADLTVADGASEVGTISAVVCDLADEESVRRAVGEPPAVDHLVVTAAPGRGVTDRGFFDGKFWGSRAACAAAAERLPEDGSILLVSGGLAVRPVPGQWSVTCAFAAVEALARAMAVDLAPRRVNCIRPGLFDTASWAGMSSDERERFFTDATADLPAGRPATEEDFGDAAIGLMASRYITGQVVVVDGGAAVRG
ncbi:MAG: SDR family oxidoreductase [Pseudonocardia sp.]|nr:SDR family oxidoreductase [Pseudonocardia sp.]